MEKQEIKSLIVEYQEFVRGVRLVERPIELEENANYVFVGMRRTGKSYLLYQIIQQKLQQNFSKEDILYVNFEDERFAEATTQDLNLILECYKELYDRQPVVFLDEVQVIPAWQKFVRRLADTQYRVYVSGSNAEMLSGEIATTLGGRFIVYEVFPYSFTEFLQSNDVKLEKNWEFSNTKNKVIGLADLYVEYGGLPEILQMSNKRQWLSGVYQKIFLGDIVTRYAIRNDRAIRLLIKKLAENITKPVSFNRLANVVSAAGAKIGVSTVTEYLEHAQNSWLIFGISNYAATFSDKESIKKYYFVDNGILRLFLINGQSSALENVVASQLWRKYGADLYYYTQNVEVDFYIPHIKTAIQVSYTISVENTFNREVNALKKIANVFPVEKALIITFDEEQTVEIDDTLAIDIVPLWKWLVEITQFIQNNPH